MVSAEVLEKARADKRFSYKDSAQKPQGMGFWDMVGRWINTLLSAASRPAARPLVYAALALLVGWIVLKLLGMESSAVLQKKPPQASMGLYMPADITALDYHDAARQARARGDLRLATRFLFLHALQRLAQANVVVYRPEKTNHAYLQEIEPALQPLFSPMVDAFEQAWYGHETPAVAHFDRLDTLFTSLEDALQHGG